MILFNFDGLIEPPKNTFLKRNDAIAHLFDEMYSLSFHSHDLIREQNN